MTKLLTGKKGLIVGIANEDSIAWGCAEVFHHHGSDLAITYLNDKTKANVEDLAKKIHAPILMKLDVTNHEEQELLFAKIARKWGKLDFLLHSVAYAPKIDLQGRVVDCSSEGFAKAMDVSCHSLMRLAKSAEPLMKEGGTILTISFYGAAKVVTNYNLMGPVKAALESSVKYLAAELGTSNIRVNALSSGPIKTKAASGLTDFDQLMEEANKKAPLHQLVTLKQIGEMAAFLVSENASQVTGQIIYVDAGYNVNG
ncbi:Enoyl-[acyl-carrier-protein] reductase [NADH] FabI [Candidatus Arcanobacter lacustris]|jgi:enoyl-[acyl-carrier protein] reductase I|uniref:Enoyl-[acyl-carrier-protein] reductase [NADH] n=1 Tax=Candidatus Arcanibacter lacustris TaxID=1607817 RepID=A0A0F5MPR4_9RICK|nr:Enoyl-[acyl-carrier-protein] reductase [NADH] FabI [Candidatus Arcanobacter lacustris]